MLSKTLVMLLSGAIQLQAQAEAPSFKTFVSPSGLKEECRILAHIPGGQYTAHDSKQEDEYCALNFYDESQIALCPKTWSTSPGTIIVDISGSGKTQSQYEAQASCGGNQHGHETIAKFKQTMNQSGTSGTFAPSSLLYYHLSRFLNTTVQVPVAVYRTMDKEAHLNRVSRRAADGKMGKSGLNRGGWDWMKKSELNPAAYKPTGELFTADNKQIYGVIVDGGGTRYGTEINGIRSAWGVAQNNDFQNTPAFLALRSEKPLTAAIAEGVSSARRDAKINRDLGPEVSNLQVALWMKELSEIALMDYIFSQQDRVGNIDFKWRQLSVENGALKMKKVDLKTHRAATKIGENWIQQTQLNDNDAGGRVYANFTKKTQMLQKIRHLSAETYRQLLALAADFQHKGDLYKYFQAGFLLSPSQLNQMVSLTVEAAGILHATCKAGQMHFDLFTAQQLMTEKTAEPVVNCDQP